MSNTSSAKLSILLVEDNTVTAMTESVLLSSGGYNVFIASSGEEALDFMRYNKGIDIVLMDVDLGEGMSGIEAASVITSKYYIPLLFYTGHDELDLFLSADEIVNEFGYIPKNSSKLDVLDVIKNALFIKNVFKNSYEDIKA